MENPLSNHEKDFLLTLARQTIVKAVNNQPLPTWNDADLTDAMKQKGASFVTLTKDGDLRGCIGSLEAYQSLIEDVRDHARQAALEDYRFPPVKDAEIPRLHIEISRLTPSFPLKYHNPEDLPGLLNPNVDGVILKDGFRRATFLPQVWQQLPKAEEFLSHLCTKMGAASDLWLRKVLEVSIYHVEEFEEK
ncbi:MAG TPA: AmmeMemoRadiSam system protein A [Anaerolineaceae bacterium]|nr:AmmeMemoRadiSam system protein A [Anaerolineaceae bacterium]